MSTDAATVDVDLASATKPVRATPPAMPQAVAEAKEVVTKKASFVWRWLLLMLNWVYIRCISMEARADVELHFGRGRAAGRWATTKLFNYVAAFGLLVFGFCFECWQLTAILGMGVHMLGFETAGWIIVGTSVATLIIRNIRRKFRQ